MPGNSSFFRLVKGLFDGNYMLFLTTNFAVAKLDNLGSKFRVRETSIAYAMTGWEEICSPEVGWDF